MPEEITIRDVHDVRSAAIDDYVASLPHCRLRGMTVDITDEDKRILSYISATIKMLSRKGLICTSNILPSTAYTEIQEVLDEGIVGHTFTKQK